MSAVLRRCFGRCFLARLVDGLRHIRLAGNGGGQVCVTPISCIGLRDSIYQCSQVTVLSILLPRGMVRPALRDQPRIVLTRIVERVVVSEFEVLDDGLAVHHFACRDCAVLRVAIGLFDPKVVSYGRRASCPRPIRWPTGQSSDWLDSLFLARGGRRSGKLRGTPLPEPRAVILTARLAQIPGPESYPLKER